MSRPLRVALPRRAIPRICIALAALALLGGGWLWLRNSPLVSVDHVQITGVQGVDAGPIDAALRGTARHMSTLNVNVGALRAAVAPFRVVRGLSISTSFPHGLRIHVVEQLPVAALSAGGVRTAVAADGVVLGPDLLSSQHVPLPAVTLAAGSPALADLRSVGGHVEDATARAELSVLGASPRVLLGWIDKVFTGHEGLMVAMRGGLEIYFGDATRPHAKWLAAARVLADPSSAGASYVDVRAPERPAAGTTSAGGESSPPPPATPAQGSGLDTTAAALARALAAAVSGGSSGAAAAAGQAAGGSGAAEPSGAAAATGQTPGGSSTAEPAAAGSSSGITAAGGNGEEESPSTSG